MDEGMKELFKAFFEESLNPFIIFDSSGEVREYNKEGEFLLTQMEREELFNLAVNYASMHFGFKKTAVNLQVGHTTFCILQVGYVSAEEIGLVLYKNLCTKKYEPKSSDLQQANIFTLIDLALETNIPLETKVVKEYDVSIPDFKIDIKNFLRFLNKIFKQLHDQKEIFIRVKMAMGEYIVIGGKKYPVVIVEIASPKELDVDEKNYLYTLSRDKIVIELPLIM